MAVLGNISCVCVLNVWCVGRGEASGTIRYLGLFWSRGLSKTGSEFRVFCIFGRDASVEYTDE